VVGIVQFYDRPPNLTGASDLISRNGKIVFREPRGGCMYFREAFLWLFPGAPVVS